MSFLAPFYLLGALAIALPILFHLVRHASREKMPFSSLMFLRPTPPRLTRRNRLEQWLLLLLRCAALGILAVGFARPYLRRPLQAQTSAQAGVRQLLLVDRSASMRREGLWREAVQKAERALQEATAADEVAVLVFDDRADTVVSFEQWRARPFSERAAWASQQLSAREPGWHGTHTGDALMAAVNLLEDASRSNHLAERVVLVTDLQEGSHLDPLQGHDWPRELEVVVDGVKTAKPTNAGLQWVPDETESGTATNGAVARVRVSNSAESTREQFQVSWEQSGPSAGIAAYVPPGQSRILSVPIPAGAQRGRVLLQGDDHAFDNAVQVAPLPTEDLRVLCLGEAGAAEATSPRYFLQRACTGTVRQHVLLSDGGKERRSRAELSQHALIVVTGSLEGGQAEEIRAYLTEGGTVLMTLEDAAAGRTLAALSGLSDVSVQEAAGPGHALWGRVDFSHPLFAPLADPRFSDFSKIRFWKHRVVRPETWNGARVVASFDNDDPAILEIPAGNKGRLVLLTFSWRPAESQFALSSKFVPMLASLVEWAGGAVSSPAAWRVGDVLDWSGGMTEAAKGALSMRLPSGVTVPLEAGTTRFERTDEPGLYELSGLAQPRRWAVNVDPQESRTKALSVDDLARLGMPTRWPGVQLKGAPNAVTLHHAELEERQKAWRWWLMGALGLLLAETWLAAGLSRPAAAASEATS